jgi:outer membrane protein OmpA-like peptidoglycan-associated protein
VPAPGAGAGAPQARDATRDRDRDGIADSVDKCPGDAETLNGYEDQDGCPDLSPQSFVTAGDITKIVERIAFEHDSAAIRPASFAMLDAIAVVLKMQPQQFPLVALEGHAADNEHSPMKLSLARASAVRVGLLARGVDADRLLARASGTTAPSCTAETESCWAHERTVEFVTIATAKSASASEPEGSRAEDERAPEPKLSADKAAAASVPLERVEFRKGSAALTPAALPNLDVLAGFMKATPTSLEIVGYADDAERKPATLAQARADAVRHYMMACGVSGRYLTTRSERTSRAACRTHSANCPARDGRAELRFVEPAPPAASPATGATPSPPPTPDGQ